MPTLYPSNIESQTSIRVPLVKKELQFQFDYTCYINYPAKGDLIRAKLVVC